LPVGVSRFATDVEANALRGILHRTTKARNVRAQAPRSDLQRSRPDRDTGPPRVRTTSPPAKKDSRSKGSKARPATKTRNVRAQAPRSDLQSLRPARDTGPPRVRTTNPPAKKDSRSKGSKARPAPGSARRPGRVVKGRGRPQTRKG
jgi:hypothetical protein